MHHKCSGKIPKFLSDIRLKAISQEVHMNLIHNPLGDYTIKMLLHLPGATELKVNLVKFWLQS